MQEQGQSQLGILVTSRVVPEEAGAQEQRQSRLGTLANKAQQPRFQRS